ncbi:MAG: hypothetical protein MR274_01990 [Clostridium sp.]|nr:hypothetical protein [Clostridium sp.]
MPIFLLLLGIILIIINIKAVKKDDNSFKNVLQYNKKDMSEATIAIGQIRQDVAESLTELQQDILEIKARLSKLEANSNNLDSSKEKGFTIDAERMEEVDRNELLDLEALVAKDEAIINEVDNKTKTDRIKQLIKEGYSDEEICNKLSVGKGEILLVKGLFKS